MVFPSTSEVSASQAARLLNVSRNRVAALIFKGLLPARAVGRQYVINTDDIEVLKEMHPDLVTPIG